jgi:hypothetical protein
MPSECSKKAKGEERKSLRRGTACDRSLYEDKRGGRKKAKRVQEKGREK